MKDKNIKEILIKIFETKLEAVVITIDNLSTVFQLLDSQNTRGKEFQP